MLTEQDIKYHLKSVRESLIALRDDCLSKTLDPDGAVILSHAIRWLHFKIEDKPYKQSMD